MSNFAWYCTWALLPLVPAILLYLIFPKSEASISTAEKEKIEDAAAEPPAGIKSNPIADFLKNKFVLKLSGAVAVYFLVFYLIDPARNGYIDLRPPSRDWKLKASFRDEQGNPIPFSQVNKVEVLPNVLYQEDVDNSTLVHLGTINEREKKLTVPFSLRFLFKDFEAQAIPIRDSIEFPTFCEKRWEDARIHLRPMVIRKQNRSPEDTATNSGELIAEKKID